MYIEIRMPALSPTMEEGTLAKWLIKPGDTVSSGDLLAEIETDKATMEFEAVDEGTVTDLLVPEHTSGVKVGTAICRLAIEAEAPTATEFASAGEAISSPTNSETILTTSIGAGSLPPAKPARPPHRRLRVSPIARRLAKARGIDLSGITGSGPNGRIVRADVDGIPTTTATLNDPISSPAFTTPTPAINVEIPHSVVELSGMRKVIARRLAESKREVPHIYLTVDVRLDALLNLRSEINASLDKQGVRLSVNDMLIKALGLALSAVPECNVQFAGDTMLKFQRADISVAVSVPDGLTTPIISDAATRSISSISMAMKDLSTRAKSGKLKPHEYQGGSASLSNLGMMGIKQFAAIVNPPQAMIMAVGAGERRPFVADENIEIATAMSATGSFDHRAVDGADGARLMSAFREFVEKPLGMLA